MDIKVQDVYNGYDCPFKHEESYQLGEYTTDVDVQCNLMDRVHCPGLQLECPLVKQGTIVVKYEGAKHG